jgi:repressor LexA
MTDREIAILEFIKAYMRLHGVSPSYEVIARGVGLRSKSNIHRLIHKLEEMGHIRLKPYKFRSIKLIDRSVAEVSAL